MIEPKNLLIVRTDRIGDVILSLPLAGVIKKKYPECKITFLVRDYTKSLVMNHPFIDEYLILNVRNGRILLKKNIDLIKKYRFDSSVIVYPTFRTALIIFQAGIKNRIGTGYRWYSLLFNKKVYEHRKYAEKHELEFNFNLLQFFGIKEDVNKSSISFDLTASGNSIKEVEKILADKKVDLTKPLIIIHPGSGGSSVDLPVLKMRELVELMADNLNVTVILTGTESEKSICSELSIRKEIINLAGEFSLANLIAVIDKASIFISNSTGPLHIAAALGKNVIAFYPKILSSSARRWGPYSDKSIIFEPAIECSNCSRKQCNNLDCMNSINMTEVFDAVKKFTN